MVTKAEWLIEIDLLGELIPHPKENWLRLIITPDVAADLLIDLECVLKNGKRAVIKRAD